MNFAHYCVLSMLFLASVKILPVNNQKSETKVLYGGYSQLNAPLLPLLFQAHTKPVAVRCP